MENRSLPVVWLLLLLAIQWQSHDALVETVDQSEGVILTCRPPSPQLATVSTKLDIVCMSGNLCIQYHCMTSQVVRCDCCTRYRKSWRWAA